MEQQPFSGSRTPERSRWFRPGDWPIQAKALLGMVAVVVLALAVATAVNAFSLYTDLREEISTNFQNLAANQVNSLSEIFSKQLTMLQSLTLVHEVQDSAVTANARYSGDQEAIEAELLEMDQQWVAAADDSQLVQSIVDPGSNRLTRQLLGFMESFPDHVEIFMTDRYGGLLASTGRTSDYYQADEGWWQAAYNEGQGAFYIGQPEYDESAGYTALNMAIPIYGENGRVAGIARTTFRVDAVYEVVSAMRLGETGHVAVIDSAGLIVADPNQEHIGELVPSTWLVPEIVDAASGWQELVDAEGDPVLAGYASFAAAELDNQAEEEAVRSLGWVLFLAQLRSEANAPVTGAVWRGILVAGAFTLVAAGLALVVARALVTPITDLAAVARGMAAGDLSVRARSRRRDETGELASAYNNMADQIEELVGGLEQTVAERTRDLEQRAVQLATAAEVGRAAASMLEADQLIREVVELIRERFGLYYVGLFLVEEAGAGVPVEESAGEWAMLQAGTGEAGRAMLARGHRIRVGEGMIGWSVAQGQPRVAQLAEEDAVRLATAELPDTRSEAALPLRSRGRVLGALSVQHTQPGVFDEDTMAVLQTMADQVAVALENARLFSESQAALESAQRAYGELSRAAWNELLRPRTDWGYRYAQQTVAPVDGMWRPEMLQAGQTGEIVGGDGDGDSSLAIPLKVRDQVVGVLGFRKGEGNAWTDEEAELLQSFVTQLEAALESARLYQETQQRAVQEQLTSEITTRMRETLDVDTVLRTAIREMGTVLGIPRVEVRMATGTTQVRLERE